MSTTGAPSLASLTRNSSKKQQLTRIFDEFVDREFRNDDELPEDLELLVELANGGLQPRQKWVPVSKSHASHSLLAATDSTTTGRGLGAKGPARSASPPPGRRLGGYLRKMTPMDIHCINLYLRKKMQLLRAEVLKQDEATAEALLQKERDLISRVEEEARRCQYALQRQQTNEKDHVLMLERKIAEKEREMDSLRQQRDEAFVEVDAAKQEIRDYDKKHRQDLKDVEKLAKAELQKVRDQFAKEDLERKAELEERLACNRAELDEREKLLGDYVGRADELRNMVEKMEAEKQFADAEAAKKVDSMKNLIGQDTSASFQCQKYFFLLWRFSVLGDQRDKAQESFQRLVTLNEQRMQNLMGMFSSSRESTDPGEYFRRWKVYTEKHAGERRQLRIAEKQNLQVVDLILAAKHTEWKAGFFQKLNRGRLAAKWRQRIFRLWEKRGVKSVLGEWKNAVTEEKRRKQLRRIRAQNRRAFDDSKTWSNTSGSPSKRKEISGEQVESPAGSDNDGRRATDEQRGGILAKTAEFCDQRYYFQAWRFAKCEDERERVTASWQHLVALNEKKLESLTAVFATSGKVDIGQSFRRWRNFTRENFRERSKAMIVISKRRVAYEMVFHNWRFMMELERERERQIEGVKALKAGQKAVFASLFGSHWDSYEQALTAQYFNLWLGETKDAHKRDREKKLQIQKELAHKRLAAFQTGLSGANQLLLSGSFSHWQKTASGLKQSQQMANALSQKAEIQEFLSGSLKRREELFVTRSCFRLWHVLEVEGRREQKEREKKLLASAAANRNRLALKFTTESNKNVLQVMWNSWKTFVANAKQSKERLAFKEKVGQNMLMATNTGVLTEIFRTWAKDTKETISARNKAAEDAERSSELAKLRAKQERAAQERVQRVALMVGTKCDDFNKGLAKSSFYAWSVEVRKLAKFKKHRRTNVSKTLEKNFSQSLQQTTFYGWKILAKRTRNLKSRDSAVGIMIHSHNNFLLKDLLDLWRQVTVDEKRIVEKQALLIKYSASCRRMCQHFTKKFDNEHMFARWLSALQKRKRRDVLASSMLSKKELSGGVVAYKCFVTWRGEIELAKRGKAEVKALELEVSCAKYRRDVGRILARKWEDLQCVSLVNAFREWRKAFRIRKKTEGFKTVIEMHAFVAEVRHAWAVWRHAVLRERRIRHGLWGISLRDRNRVLGASLRAWRAHSVGVFTEIIPRLEHAWRDYTSSSAGQLYQNKNFTHSDGDEATAVSSIAVADASLASTPRGAVGAGILSHRSLSDDEAHEERSGPGSFFSRSSQSKLMSREEREEKRKLQQQLRARASSVVVVSKTSVGDGAAAPNNNFAFYSDSFHSSGINTTASGGGAGMGSTTMSATVLEDGVLADAAQLPASIRVGSSRSHRGGGASRSGGPRIISPVLSLFSDDAGENSRIETDERREVVDLGEAEDHRCSAKLEDLPLRRASAASSRAEQLSRRFMFYDGNRYIASDEDDDGIVLANRTRATASNNRSPSAKGAAAGELSSRSRGNNARTPGGRSSNSHDDEHSQRQDFLQRAVESSPSHARHKRSRSRNRTNVVSRPSTTLEGRTVVAHHASRSSILIHALWQRKYETGLWFLRWRLRVLLHGKQLRQKSLLSRWGTYLNSLFVSATPHHAQKPVLQLSFYKWQLCLTRSKANRRALWAERRALKFREWNLVHLYLHNWQAAAMQERAERNAREEAARRLAAEEERILAEKKREEDERERAEKIRIEQELKIREQQQELIRLQAEEAAADLRKRTEEEVEEQQRWADEAKHEKRLAEVQAALRKREEEVLREMELDRRLVEEEHVGMMNVMKGKVEDARGSGSTGKKIPQIANLISDNVGVVVPPDYLAVPVDEARSQNRLPRAASLYKPTGTLPDVDEVLLQRYSIEELRRNEELAQLRRQADEVVRMKRAELELEKQKLRQELRVKLQKAEEEQAQHFDTERDRYVALLEMCATAKSEIASGKREVRDLEERAEALITTAAAGGGHDLLGPEVGTSSGAAAVEDDVDDHSSSSAIPAVIRGKRQLARELEEVEKLVAVTARNNRKSETPGIEEAANDRRGMGIMKNSADEQDGGGVGAFICGPSGGGQPQEELFIYEPQPVPSFLSKTTSDGEQPFPQRPPPARASNNIAVAASVSTSAKNRAAASNPFPDLLPKPVAPQLTTGLPNSSMKDLSKDSVARDKQPIPVVDTDLVGGGLGSRYNLPDRVDVVSTVENSAQTSSMRKSLRAKLEPGRDEAASSSKVGTPFVPESRTSPAKDVALASPGLAKDRLSRDSLAPRARHVRGERTGDGRPPSSGAKVNPGRESARSRVTAAHSAQDRTGAPGSPGRRNLEQEEIVTLQRMRNERDATEYRPLQKTAMAERGKRVFEKRLQKK